MVSWTLDDRGEGKDYSRLKCYVISRCISISINRDQRRKFNKHQGGVIGITKQDRDLGGTVTLIPAERIADFTACVSLDGTQAPACRKGEGPLLGLSAALSQSSVSGVCKLASLSRR